MNGVINIYKERGCTSFHLVYELRKITGEQKVGHTGTLDPNVTGVLPICLGKSTKLVGQLTDTDKTYHCRMLLGKRTDTQDLTGQLLEEMDPEQVKKILKTSDKFEEAILHFVGDIEQLPPMYSALKVDGVKLVDAARRGVEIERKSRVVTVYAIRDIQVAEDLMTAEFTVECSKGTYIRTLCEDIGKYLGIPACMEDLERTCASGLDLSSALTLDQVKAFAQEGTLEEHLIPPDTFLQIYPQVMIRDEFKKHLVYGNYIYRRDLILTDEAENGDMPDTENSNMPGTENGDMPDGEKTEKICGQDIKFAPDQIYRVYDSSGEFYALYQYSLPEDCLKCVKMFKDIE